MLNYDSGSTFNVESRPGVIIQHGIKTWGSQFNGGPNFIRRRGRNTMTPCLGALQFNMKNPLNPEHSPLNQGPTGRNSMGSKFNPTPVVWCVEGSDTIFFQFGHPIAFNWLCWMYLMLHSNNLLISNP